MQENLPIVLSLFEKTSKRSDKVYFAYDIDGNEILYLNSAFEEIWRQGIDKASAEPVSVLERVHQEDQEYLQQAYRDFVSDASMRDIEFRLQMPDGRVKWMCLKPLLLESVSDKRIVAGLVEDVTVEKEHYSLLDKFAAKKNSVLEILSHDLAGPLSTIKATSSMLADEIENLNNPNLTKMVDMIIRTSERSIHLIREFVKHEFLASVNDSTAKKRVNIVEKIRYSVDQYKEHQSEIAKNFKFHASPEKIFMEVDDYKFLQVINNLISNAIKFTPDGGTISISIEDQKENVLFIIADDGIGIPEKYHDSLFQKFNPARRPGLKGEPSVGLGMSIIKTIVDWHQGKIWFESKEDEGTTFYIQLPKK